MPGPKYKNDKKLTPEPPQIYEPPQSYEQPPSPQYDEYVSTPVYSGPVPPPRRPTMKSRTFTEDEVVSLIKRAREEDDNKNQNVGLSNSLVKQLETTVSIFNTLKDFSSNPLTKAIEGKVGQLSADVIEKAFTKQEQRENTGKKDYIEMFMNSQLGYGIGQGLGQRAPETIDSMGRLFGKERVDNFLDIMTGKYGGGTSGRGAVPPSAPPSSPRLGQGEQYNSGYNSQNNANNSQNTGSHAGRATKEEREILLSLSPDNPEHVAAYAETQGGIDLDLARKMLMIHHDAFVKQIKDENIGMQETLGIRQEPSVEQSVYPPYPPVEVEPVGPVIEPPKSVSFKDKKGEYRRVEGVDEVEEVPEIKTGDSWEGEEGELSIERKLEEKNVLVKKEMDLMRSHSPAVEAVKKEVEERNRINQETKKILDENIEEEMKTEEVPEVLEMSPVPEEVPEVAEVVPFPEEVTELPVTEETQASAPEWFKTATPIDHKAMCSYCHKIKNVLEINGKRMCDDCIKKKIDKEEAKKIKG